MCACTHTADADACGIYPFTSTSTSNHPRLMEVELALTARAETHVPSQLVCDFVNGWIRSVEGHGEEGAHAVQAVQHMPFYQRLQRFVATTEYVLGSRSITPISKQIKCISPQVRSVNNPAGDVVSRPRLLLRDREAVNRNRTRQINLRCVHGWPP